MTALYGVSVTNTGSKAGLLVVESRCFHLLVGKIIQFLSASLTHLYILSRIVKLNELIFVKSLEDYLVPSEDLYYEL